jgi:type II secretory pathway pseudopilin PulG
MLTLRSGSVGERGFTVVELLVVLLLTGVVGGIVTAAIVSSLRVTRDSDDRITALIDLQRGVERVGRELRAANPLILDASMAFADEITAEVQRDGARWRYRYYLQGDEETGWELREDVRRYEGDTIVEQRDGLFITGVANHETGTPLFRYFAVNPETRALEELVCDEDVSASECRDRHATASQVMLTLERLVPNGPPTRVESSFNIRNTRFGTIDMELP